MSKSRLPDFLLKGLNKHTDEIARHLGAGWKNEDGSITIKLEPLVAVNSDPDWVYTLFLNDRKEIRTT